MAIKEARRQQAAVEKRKEQLSQKITVVKNEWTEIGIKIQIIPGKKFSIIHILSYLFDFDSNNCFT